MDITNTQPIQSINYNIGFIRRFVALIIDCLICPILATIATPIVLIFIEIAAISFNFKLDEYFFIILWFHLILLMHFLYYIASWSSKKQATIGERIIRYKIVGNEDTKMTKWQLLKRYLIALLPFSPIISCYIFLYYVDHKIMEGDPLGITIAIMLVAAYLLTIIFSIIFNITIKSKNNRKISIIDGLSKTYTVAK